MEKFFFLIFLLFLKNVVLCNEIQNAIFFEPTEASASNWVKNQDNFEKILDSSVVGISLWKSWTHVLDNLLNHWIQGPNEAEMLERSLTSLENNIGYMKNLIQRKRNLYINATLENDSAIPHISPAFRWAQSNTAIYIQVKLSYRWSSPGALSVRNEKITIEPTFVRFSGIGTHSTVQKLYELNLPLYGSVSANNSTWLWGSVGKLSITLQKDAEGLWPRLLNTTNKVPNMHIWHEMEDTLSHDKEEFNVSSSANQSTVAIQPPLSPEKEEL